jgi:thiol-disulfide isomerase/thioredoxin
MFFSVFLPLLGSASDTEQTLHQLTASTFRRLVLKRSSHDVWLVMFTGPNCPACKQAYPRFVNASKVAEGLFQFGVLDIERAPDIAQDYEVHAIPQFRIFHSHGDTEYVGKRKERDFINHAAGFIEDLSQQTERSWVDSMLARPSAILFTDKPKTPPMWAGISAYFHSKSIRIGISREDPEMMTLYNVSKAPSILFMNGTNSKIYRGKISFGPLKKAIDQFFAKRLKIDAEEPAGGDFLIPSEFEAKCLGGRHMCIVSVSKQPAEELEKLAQAHSRHKILWFVGISQLPFQFMDAGGVWIYNPRRDGFLHVPEIGELATALDRVLDGAAKWKSRASLVEQPL